MSSLKDKIAVVTGGTRGIGRAIAEELLDEGASVMICSRDAESVRRAVSEMKSLGKGSVDGIRCDVRDHNQVKELIRLTLERFGGIDILVNNAGVGIFRSIVDLTPEQWHEVIDTNLTGVYYCCREAIPHMKRRGGGYIINISSLAGKNAFAGGAAYNASKFGLNGFSEAIMQDLRYDNIRVSYIMPGSVKTQFGDQSSPSGEWKLHPQDIARLVIDLLKHDPRSLPSCVEIRPSKPPKKA